MADKRKNLCHCGNEKGVNAKRCVPCKHKHNSELLKGREHHGRPAVIPTTNSNLVMHKYLQMPLVKTNA